MKSIGPSLKTGYFKIQNKDILDSLKSSLQISSKEIIKSDSKRIIQTLNNSYDNRTSHTKSNKLIVRNLAFESKKENILSLFRLFGMFKSLRIPKKFDESQRGFIFIEMFTSKQAERITEKLNNSNLYGRNLIIEKTY